MTNSQIILQANQLVKSKNFTKLSTPSNLYCQLFLIEDLGNGNCIYGSCVNERYFVTINYELFRLSY